MSVPTLDQAVEAIYSSLNNDNEDIDLHIANLKQAMQADGTREASFDASRLVQGNRAGRKLMQSYFRKRGVSVTFTDGATG